MLRLKNRQMQLPYGLTFRQEAFNWRARPYTNFNTIVAQVITLRLANPHVSKQHGLATDEETVANEVDYFNAKNAEKMGWLEFIDGSDEGVAPVPFSDRTRNPNQNVSAGKGVVAGIKNASAGLSLAVDWLGDELYPVDLKVAEERAAICVKGDGGNPCPKNGDPNWLEKLTGAAAEEIRSLMGLKNEMSLRTTLDKQLHVCRVCGCHLPLKVWVNSDYVKKKLTDDQRAELPIFCWMLQEK